MIPTAGVLPLWGVPAPTEPICEKPRKVCAAVEKSLAGKNEPVLFHQSKTWFSRAHCNFSPSSSCKIQAKRTGLSKLCAVATRVAGFNSGISESGIAAS